MCDVYDDGDDAENQQTPSHTHLPCLVIVFDLTQIPAAGLSDPLPRHQIPDHHRRRTDLWRRSRETRRELGMNGNVALRINRPIQQIQYTDSTFLSDYSQRQLNNITVLSEHSSAAFCCLDATEPSPTP